MANEDIKEALKKHNIKQWQLADMLGTSESVLSKKLRYELSDQEKKTIMDKIKGAKE